MIGGLVELPNDIPYAYPHSAAEDGEWDVLKLGRGFIIILNRMIHGLVVFKS